MPTARPNQPEDTVELGVIDKPLPCSLSEEDKATLNRKLHRILTRKRVLKASLKKLRGMLATAIEETEAAIDSLHDTYDAGTVERIVKVRVDRDNRRHQIVSTRLDTDTVIERRPLDANEQQKLFEDPNDVYVQELDTEEATRVFREQQGAKDDVLRRLQTTADLESIIAEVEAVLGVNPDASTTLTPPEEAAPQPGKAKGKGKAKAGKGKAKAGKGGRKKTVAANDVNDGDDPPFDDEDDDVDDDDRLDRGDDE